VAFLTGEYCHAIDSKGRLTIPAKLRESINAAEEGFGFIAVAMFDKVLYLYTPNEYRLISPKLAPRLEANADVRKFKRLRYGMAEHVEVDGLGRILIPDRFLKRCSLTKDVALVGCEDHIEVWDRARWDAFSDENVPQQDELAARVMALVNDGAAPAAPAPQAAAKT